MKAEKKMDNRTRRRRETNSPVKYIVNDTYTFVTWHTSESLSCSKPHFSRVFLLGQTTADYRDSRDKSGVTKGA